MYDLHTQIVVFVSASYDKKMRAHSTKELANIYKQSLYKMRHLLNGLVMDKRLARIFHGGAYFYGPIWCVSIQGHPVEPEIFYEEEEQVGRLRRLWNWLITPLGGERI